MASSAQTQGSLYLFTAQGYPCELPMFDEWQHATGGGEEYPQSSNRISSQNTALWRPPSWQSRKRKATIATPDAAFFTDYTRNESPNLSVNTSIEWNDEWTSRKRSATLTNRHKENNNSHSWMPVPGQEGIHFQSSSDMFNALQGTGEPVQPDVPGGNTFDDTPLEDESFSSSAEKRPLLSYAVANPPPLYSDSSFVDQAQTSSASWSDAVDRMTIPTALPAPGTQGYNYELGLYESTSSYYTPIPSQICMSLEGSAYGKGNAFALEYNDSDLGTNVAIKNDSFAVHAGPDNSLSATVRTKVSVQRALLPVPPSLDAITATASDVVSQSSLAIQNKRRSLTMEERLETAELRKIGSCERCKNKKIKCTRGIACGPCRRYHGQALDYEIPCHREKIDPYIRAFFPVFVTAHFEKSAILDKFRNIQMSKKTKQVYMSLGPSYPQFPVDICEFVTEQEDLSYVSDLASTTNDQLKSFASIPTLQYVVPEAAITSFKRTCRQYVDDMNNFFDKTLGNSGITRAVFDAARRFHGSNTSTKEDIMLRDILRIITAYHLLGRRLYFVEDPRLNSSGSPQHKLSDTASRYFHTSNLINIQFKAAMHELIKELLPGTLFELDGRLGGQEKVMLAPCLCAILLISTCIEEVQIVGDAYTLTRISNNEGEPASIRRHGREICGVLEQWALEHLQLLQNSAFDIATKRHSRLEPGFVLDTGAEIPDPASLGGAGSTLAGDLQHICDQFDMELREHEQDDYFGGLSQDVGQNQQFRKSNRARLTSKILLSWKTCVAPAEAPSCDPSLLQVLPEK